LAETGNPPADRGNKRFDRRRPRCRAGLVCLVCLAVCFVSASKLQATVLNGIDVLARDGFEQLAGRKVGLITNQTGHTADRVSTVRLLAGAANVELVALFSPEHGFAGELERSEIASGVDDETGVVIHSLYGKTRKPTAEMLEGLDTLVFDIQDIGTRFYTYISTMGLAMEAAACPRQAIRRPRPSSTRSAAISSRGRYSYAGKESFVGYHPVPVRHGMTAGELARMFVAEKNLQLNLQVVPIEGGIAVTF